MASLIYTSAIADAFKGSIDFDTDTFYCMLTTSSYAENKDTHTKRSDVTNEVAATGGYVAGGFVATVSVSTDTANDRVVLTLGGISVSSATITASKAVYYKRRGGASSADELVAVVDFGSPVVSTAGTWALTSTTLYVNN